MRLEQAQATIGVPFLNAGSITRASNLTVNAAVATATGSTMDGPVAVNGSLTYGGGSSNVSLNGTLGGSIPSGNRLVARDVSGPGDAWTNAGEPRSAFAGSGGGLHRRRPADQHGADHDRRLGPPVQHAADQPGRPERRRRHRLLQGRHERRGGDDRRRRDGVRPARAVERVVRGQRHRHRHRRRRPERAGRHAGRRRIGRRRRHHVDRGRRRHGHRDPGLRRSRLLHPRRDLERVDRVGGSAAISGQMPSGHALTIKAPTTVSGTFTTAGTLEVAATGSLAASARASPTAAR